MSAPSLSSGDCEPTPESCDEEFGASQDLCATGAVVGESSDRSGDRFSCYILVSSTGKSRYVGMTCDLRRRLRQHNKEIKGGARATSRGGPWRYAAVISGFVDHHEALTAEWRLKRLGQAGRGPVAVLKGLSALLKGCLHSTEGVRSWTSSSRYDFRSSGLCLHVLRDLAALAPGLVGAVEGVGWVCMTVEAVDPLEVLREMPVSVFRPELPSREPVRRKKRWHSSSAFNVSLNQSLNQSIASHRDHGTGE